MCGLILSLRTDFFSMGYASAYPIFFRQCQLGIGGSHLNCLDHVVHFAIYCESNDGVKGEIPRTDFFSMGYASAYPTFSVIKHWRLPPLPA